MNPTERFWAKVRKGNPDECWPWLGYVDRKTGYGRFGSNGKVNSAQRFAWESTFGPVPPGLLVCHKCDNPVCQNPNHLWLGSYSDNNADMRTKGRAVKPPSQAKLTEGQVRLIRRMWVPYKVSIRQISQTLGLPYKACECAVSKQKWKSVL